MNLIKQMPHYDFSGLEVFDPKPHPAIEQVVNHATEELNLRFPEVSFELIPLGSGRGVGSKVKAIVNNQPDSAGWLEDLDMGIIIADLGNYPRNYFLYEATLVCQEKAETHGLSFCNQFNLFNCNTFTSSSELKNKIYLVFSSITNFGIMTEEGLPDNLFYQLFSLGLPFLSRDLKVRLAYITTILELINDPDIRPFWNADVQKVWSQVFRNTILPPVKHFHDDSVLKADFISQLGLEYL